MHPDEVARLLKIINSKNETVYLPQTRKELDDHLGPGVAESVLGEREVRPLVEGEDLKHSALICTVILPGERLALPDNLTRACDWGCGRTIQHRPWAPSGLQRVCLYCMAEKTESEQ